MLLWPFNFLFNCVEYISKPLSHSLRLFGNMYAGEILFLLLWLIAATGLFGTIFASLLGLGWAIFHILIVLLQWTFASIFRNTNDPVLRTMIQFTMTDEAFHHKFGKIWADRTIPGLPEEERIKIEDWAWSTFQSLLANLNSPELKQDIYAQFGLDWRWVNDCFSEAMQNSISRNSLSKIQQCFPHLCKNPGEGEAYYRSHCAEICGLGRYERPDQ